MGVKSPAKIRAKHAKQAIAGVRELLLVTHPDSDALQDADDTLSTFALASMLLGLLAVQLGQDDTREAFDVLRAALFSGVGVASGHEAWASAWRGELAKGDLDERADALTFSVRQIVAVQPLRARDLAGALLKKPGVLRPAWFAAAVPRLLVTAALSLACSEDDADADTPSSSVLAIQLLERASCLAREVSSEGPTQSSTLHALAYAFELSTSSASTWCASHIAKSLCLPAELPRLCAGTGSTAHDYSGARRFVGSLLVRLDPTEAVALRSRPFEIVAGAGISAATSAECVASIALMPCVLPAAAEENWQLCKSTVLVVNGPFRRRRMHGSNLQRWRLWRRWSRRAPATR